MRVLEGSMSSDMDECIMCTLEADIEAESSPCHDPGLIYQLGRLWGAWLPVNGTANVNEPQHVNRSMQICIRRFYPYASGLFRPIAVHLLLA